MAEQRHFDILDRGQRRQQIEVLENYADFAAPERRPFLARAGRQIIPIDLARVRRIDAAQDVEQAALPAAAGPENGNAFAGGDDKIHLVQGNDRAIVVAALDALQPDQGV